MVRSATTTTIVMSGEEEKEEARNKWFHINRSRTRRKMKGNKSVYVDAMAFFENKARGVWHFLWHGWRGNSIRTNCRLGVKHKKEKKLQQETEKWQLFFVSLLSLSHLFLRTFANHPPPPWGRRGGKIADIAHTSAQKRKFLFNNSGRMWGIEVPSAPKVIFTSDNEGKAKGRQKPKKTCDRKT